MIAYHSIPLLIVRGGIDSPAQFRPFLLSASLAVAVMGFYQMWRCGAIGLAGHGPQRCHTLVFSHCCPRNDLVSAGGGKFLGKCSCELIMNRKKAAFLAVVVIAVFLIYYLYGGSTTPTGQQPLVRLNNSNLSSLKDAFNGSVNSVRVLILVSPT